MSDVARANLNPGKSFEHASELTEASEVLPVGGLTELFGSGAHKRAETGKC